MQSSKRRRKWLLGGERVVDAQTAQPGPLGDLPRKAIICVDIAGHPAAAVNEHDRRGGRWRSGIIKANALWPARRGDRALLDMGERRCAGIQEKGEVRVAFAELLDRKFGRAPLAGQAQEHCSKDLPQDLQQNET